MRPSASKVAFRSPARSGLQALVAQVLVFFAFFSLLFSHLVFVSIFMLFLYIFGSILVAKIGHKTKENDVIIVIVFWKGCSSIVDRFLLIFSRAIFTKTLKNHCFFNVFLMLRLFSLDRWLVVFGCFFLQFLIDFWYQKC